MGQATPPSAQVPSPAWGALHDALLVVSAHTLARRHAARALGAHHCAVQPCLVSVAIVSGLWIDPLIRDSKRFVLSALASNERVLARRLACDNRHRNLDPFEGIALERLPSGACFPADALLALECEVVRHVDIEADHQLYVGRVIAFAWRNPAALAPVPPIPDTSPLIHHPHAPRTHAP
jgi:flavin reductase (DIM6/NTAB) family NADH-FMN oxidoreductase RutF